MRATTIFILLIIVSNLSFAQEVSNELKEYIELQKSKFSQFDGNWVGKISSFNKYAPGADLEYKDNIVISINGDKVKVYHKDGEDFIDPGYEYSVARKGTNIHIYTQDIEGGWAETISYTMTLESEKRLIVTWSRVVNNFVYPLKNKEARAYFLGVSVFSPY